MTVIGATGHRPKDLRGGYDWNSPANRAIRAWMRERIQELGCTLGITGGALGVDMFWASALYHSGVPYILFAPCKGQESRWPEESQRIYRAILKHAREVRYTHDGPYPGPWCMLQRNQDMVDFLAERKGILLAVWNGRKAGGTYDCIRRAAGNPAVRTVFYQGKP